MQTELSCWIALNAMQSLSFGKIKKCIKQFGNVKAIFNTSESDLLQFGLTKKQAAKIAAFNFNKIEKDLQWLQATDHHIILFDDERYPSLLKEIKDPPILLYAIGNINLLNKPQLAIVGSRKPTPFGERTAFDFASVLAQTGLVITSGLALGVDAASHRGAIATTSQTIAVLGTGLDRIYPSRHKALAQSIVQSGGLLLSEFALSTPPLRENFPRRNRIISGLSLGVLVVEAALKSGSLITARLAAEQGREVFALPGSIRNTQAKGCHHLIRDGAVLVESVEDICTELTTLLTHQHTICLEKAQNQAKITQPSKETLDFSHLEKDDIALLKLITEEPISVDQLIIQSRLSTSQVADSLLKLELDKVVKVTAGGYCRL